MSKGLTRMGLEVASAYRYIDEQEDWGPMTKEVLKGMVRRVAEGAIRDVEDFIAETPMTVGGPVYEAPTLNTRGHDA